MTRAPISISDEALVLFAVIVVLVATAVHDRATRSPRRFGDPSDESGLADPSFPGDERHLESALRRSLARAEELVELPSAPDEREVLVALGQDRRDGNLPPPQAGLG